MKNTHLEHGKSAAADFDPANYRYVMSGYNGCSDNALETLDYSAFEDQMVEEAQCQTPYSGLNRNFNGGKCLHCGKKLNWFVLFRDVRTSLLVVTGTTCCEELSLDDKGALKRKQIGERLEKARANARFDLAHPGLRLELQRVQDELAADRRSDRFYHDLNCSLHRYGSLTAPQAAALKRSFAKRLDWVEEKAKRDAAQAVANAAALDCPTGRVSITGKVLTTKEQESDFGTQYKMLVEDDRGFRVWGTIPSSIGCVERGARVTFVASVEQSPKDRIFGFYKRPSKASILEVAA
jgi:hypothetical protein